MTTIQPHLETPAPVPSSRVAYFLTAFLAVVTALVTGTDARTGVAFVLAFVCLLILFIRMDLILYGIIASAVVFIDGWAPTRSPDEVVFRLGLGRLYIIEIAVYGLLLSYAIRRALARGSNSKGPFFARTPLDRPLLAFAALLPAFALYGLLRGNPLQDAVGYYEWRCLLLAIVFYFLVVSLADTRAKAFQLFWWFFGLAALKASYSLLIYALGIEGTLPKVFGSGPVDEGPENYMFAFAALVAISLLLFGREMSTGKRALARLSVVVTVINILVSEKRTPQLGLAVGLVVLAWRLPLRQKLKWGARAVIAATALVILSALLGGKPRAEGVEASASRYTEIIQSIQDPASVLSGSGTFAFHALDWVDGWNTIVERPLLGYGFGGQLERNYTLLPFVMGEAVEPGIVHNQYLTFWLKMGVLGLAAYVWVFISFFRFGRRVIPGIPRLPGEAVSLGLYAALWGDVFMELWGPIWVGNTKFPVLVLFSIALVVCFGRETGKSSKALRDSTC